MIAAIVAADLKWGIGAGGDLLISIPADMERFRSMTRGTTVVMGRLTYESLSVKPLPKRENIIISSSYKEFTQLQEHLIGSDLAHVRSYLEDVKNDPEAGDVFIIGGGQIYKELLDCCSMVYVTRLYSTWEEADTFFPDLDASGEWTIAEEGPLTEFEGLAYRFIDYKRIV